MRKKWIIVAVTVGVVMLAGFISWGPIVSKVEQPKYKILESDGEIEIREYDPMIVAEVIVQGDRKNAINQGFRYLADYIFGNNTANNKMSMTAPVTQQQSKKIAMTAPVTQHAKESGWAVHFTMPSRFTLDTLPEPNNKNVILNEIPAKRFAVIRFSGMNTNKNLSVHEKKLLTYMSENNIDAASTPIYAFYNPPWTLPVLKRNEVLIEIENNR